MNAEQWKPIPGFTNYEASDMGNVRTWWSMGRVSRRAERPRNLRSCSHVKGYRMVNMKSDTTAKWKTVTVHSVVMLAFVSARPKGHDVNHKNGVRDDNRLGNLEWMSHAENIREKRKHGTQQHGETHPTAKYSTATVLALRMAVENGESIRSAAKRLSVGYGAASSIAHRRTWKHLT